MRKRKNGEIPLRWRLHNALGMILLATGLVAVLLVSVGATWQWIAAEDWVPNPPYRPSIAIYPTQPPRGPIIRATTQSDLSAILPEGAQLYLGTSQGTIYANGLDAQQNKQFSPTGAYGMDIAVAPDGRTLAYVRGDRVYVSRDGNEQAVNLDPGTGHKLMLGWNVEGNALTFVIRGANIDTIYRMPISNMQAKPLLSVPALAAPPLPNPANDRLLVMEKAGAQRTILYSIDPDCGCQRRDIATVNHTINWATYHPNAASIVFSDADDGNLYLLMMGSGEVQPLLVGAGYKQQPTFSKDGEWLAYTNLWEGNRLYLMRLKDRREFAMSFVGVDSLAWAR